MKKEEFTYLNAKLSDCKDIAKFINAENKLDLINADYLKWWYFEKKTAGFNFSITKSKNEIIGISTINNFNLFINNKINEVGMPQNVLTSKKFRGRGLFTNVFSMCEKESLKNKIDTFITFTNAASTHIFLKKFNYSRGRCPVLILIPIVPYFFFSRKLKKVNNFDELFLKKIENVFYDNCIIKNKTHLIWRYQKNFDKKIHILEYKKNGIVSSYIMVKFSYKKSIKICYLLDCVGEVTKELFKELKRYISSNGSFLLLALENKYFKNLYNENINFKIKERFNFLVKGRDPKETDVLSKTKFNITFGDLDFINLK